MPRILLRFLVATPMFLSGCTTAPDQAMLPATPAIGTYPPVSPQRFAGSRTSRRTGSDDGTFVWAFGSHSFRVEGPQIPSDLSRALGGDHSSPESIQGTWRISGDRIFLKNTANGHQTSLRIFNSAPSITRIESDRAQYVFSRP